MRAGRWLGWAWLCVACGAPGVGPEEDSEAETDALAPGGADTDAPPPAEDTPDTPADTDAGVETDPLAESDAPVDPPVDTPVEPPLDPPVDTGAAPFPACPQFRNPARVGTTPLFVVTEASGVAASRRNPDVLWLHNDSGADAEVHAVTPSLLGGLLGSFRLDGADAEDWEDIAVGPGPDAARTYLYVADTGDNGRSRSTVQIYRVPEPSVNAGGGPFQGRALQGVERFDLQYPDGPHDVETMMVDPLTADVYLVVKDGSGDAPVFRARAPLSAGGVTTLELVTTLQFGTPPLSGDPLTTGGDVSPAGDEIAIRTYDAAFVWRRPAGMTVDEALATAPCAVPQAAEGQGEALGFSASGDGYYTVGEGSATWINFVERR